MNRPVVADYSELMRGVPLFAGLSDDERRTVSAHSRRRRVEADQTVIYKGDTDRTLYIILSGSVRVHATISRPYDTESGGAATVTYALLGPGGFFGEMSLLDGRPRSADVTTREPTELLTIDPDNLLAALEASPPLALSLLAGMAGRIRRTNEQLGWPGDVQARVARQLLSLCEEHGEWVPSLGTRIRLRLSQRELAELVGCTRESVNKALGELRRRNLLQVHGYGPGLRWTVPDTGALERYADR